MEASATFNESDDVGIAYLNAYIACDKQRRYRCFQQFAKLMSKNVNFWFNREMRVWISCGFLLIFSMYVQNTRLGLLTSECFSGKTLSALNLKSENWFGKANTIKVFKVDVIQAKGGFNISNISNMYTPHRGNSKWYSPWMKILECARIGQQVRTTQFLMNMFRLLLMQLPDTLHAQPRANVRKMIEILCTTISISGHAIMQVRPIKSTNYSNRLEGYIFRA